MNLIGKYELYLYKRCKLSNTWIHHNRWLKAHSITNNFFVSNYSTGPLPPNLVTRITASRSAYQTAAITSSRWIILTSGPALSQSLIWNWNNQMWLNSNSLRSQTRATPIFRASRVFRRLEALALDPKGWLWWIKAASLAHKVKTRNGLSME